MLSLKKIIPDWVKTRARKFSWRYQRASWRSRSLPDFIIIGGQKCGTSSLYAYLAQHPQLYPSFTKEVHFFDGGLDPNTDNFEKGQAWYRAFFPNQKKMGPECKSFEASPLYIFNPLTPKRIFDLIPQVKLIAILRNPTDRAISHYFHETKAIGRESLPIWEALNEEENRLKSVFDNHDYKNHSFIHHSYKSRGLYKQQLERFFKYFSKQQVLVLGSEELFCEPEKVLRKVFEFLEVDSEYKVKDLTPRNVGRKKGNIDPNVYDYLNKYFLPHNQVLYDFLGKKFGW